MKTYIKPILVGLMGIIIFAAGVIVVTKLYNGYIESVNRRMTKVETQIDLSTVYNAGPDELATLYDGQPVEGVGKAVYQQERLYLPVDLIIKYINDQFFYDAKEKTLTYTTIRDVIRMKTDELTYYVNDEPVKLDFGMIDINDKPYLPLAVLEKFSHHDFVLDQRYHILQIKDWYATVKIGEVFFEQGTALIRVLPEADSQYLYKAFPGMELTITGEQADYYRIVTKDGFVGYIEKQYIRSLTETNSMKEPVKHHRQFPSSKLDGKVNLVWHQVFNTTANLKVSEKFEKVTGVNVISPTWFELKGTDGDVRSIADLDYVRWAHQNGYQVWALFGNLGSGYTKAMTHEVLSSTAKRKEAIKQMLAYAAVYELDGINIDFEAIPEEDGPYFVQFVKELSILGKQQGLVMSADLPVVKPWTKHYGRTEIAKFLDYIMIMGYDEHWGSSPVAGSVASKTFSDEGILYTLDEVPKEKIVLGIPFYTRLWKETTVDGKTKVSSKAYGMDGGKNILSENGVELTWLEDIGQYYGEYKQDGAIYKMWLEDLKSVQVRLDIARKYDIGGIAAWKLGLENDQVWPLIQDFTKS